MSAYTTLPDAGFRSDVPWPFNMKNRQDMDLDSLLVAIANDGIRATWYVSTRCPCGATTEASAYRGCPVCLDTGYEWTKQQIVRAVAVGIRRSTNQFLEPNPFDIGSAHFTVRAEHAPGYQDRIVLEDARAAIKILTERSASLASPIELLRYPIAAMTYTDYEGNDVVTSVLHMRAGDAGGEGPGAVLVEDVDYEITAGGLIDWTLGDALGTAPPPGVLFSANYYARPVYRVVDHPHIIRDSRIKTAGVVNHAALPVQFEGRLAWADDDG